MILSHHILIQACLDLMRRRNIPDIQHRLFFRLFLFLFFQFLFVGNPAVPAQIGQVHKTDVGKSILFAELVQFILQLGIVQHPLIVKLAHRLHGFVHTVTADADIVGQLKHLARLALWPPADKAYVLIIIIIAFARVFCGRGILMSFCQIRFTLFVLFPVLALILKFRHLFIPISVRSAAHTYFSRISLVHLHCIVYLKTSLHTSELFLKES